jgi:hypothetical protein
VLAVFAGYSTKSTDVNLCSQGLIWLLLATVAEVPPTVRLVVLLRTSFSLIAISRLQVLIILNLNGRFSFPPIHQRRVLIEVYSGETISASQPCTPLFAACGVEGLSY